MEAYAANLRVLQIFCAALMLGKLSFVGASLLVVNLQGQGLATGPAIPAIAAFLSGQSLLIIAATQLVSKLVRNRVSKPNVDDESLLTQYRRVILVGWAGLEGAAMMSMTGYLLAGRWWSLIVPAMTLTWMATSFPTQNRLSHWLRFRREELELVRE